MEHQETSHLVLHNHEWYLLVQEKFTSPLSTSVLNAFRLPGSTRSLYILTWVAQLKLELLILAV